MVSSSAIFLCVSVNPAIDKRIRAKTFRVGEVNRVADLAAEPGGKAAHVALSLAALGECPSWIGLAGGASGDVSFVWWTRASGATPGSDYVAGAPRMAHMPDGVDTLHLSIPILANPSRKHTEMFYVGIGKPAGGAALGSVRRATVVIMRPD